MDFRLRGKDAVEDFIFDLKLIILCFISSFQSRFKTRGMYIIN